MSTAQAVEILKAFHISAQPEAIECCGNAGGFSGSSLWRISVPELESVLCLRKWPVGFSHSRIDFIHRTLAALDREGIRQIAVPLRTPHGNTIVSRQDEFYELAAWLPGAADFSAHPTPDRLRNIMHWLARLHIASARISSHLGTPPGILSRTQFVDDLRFGLLGRIDEAIKKQPQTATAPMCRRIVAACQDRLTTMAEMLKDAATARPELIACLRDIWHDHVLFSGDEVSGVVDYGALREDCVASDLTRLLASLLGPDRHSWTTALEQYQSIRPLSDAEHQLIPVYHYCSQVLSGINWCRWIYLEQRSFEDNQRMIDRLSTIVAALG